MSLLNSLSFAQILWLVPIFFTLHNLEEAPFMERWSKRLPLKIHPTLSTRQFVIALIFLTLATFLLTFIALNFLGHATGYLLILGIQAIFLFNAFIPHIGSTIRFRMYSPGVVTAVVIVLPFSFYLYRRAFAENIMTVSQFWIMLGIAPVAMVFFIFLSLSIGKVLGGNK